LDQSEILMGAPVKLLIHGASGRMGQALIRLAQANPLLKVVAMTGRSSFPALAELPEFDVAIDFSSPEGFDAVLALCLQRGKPLVSGTTGLSPAQFQSLKQAGERIPALWASNYSLGVAVLNRLVAQAGQWLKHWQLDILESHHIHKKDAPSGTALSLGETAQAATGTEPVYHSLRCGDVVGEHTVQFTGQGERIELVHRATNRDIFAQGALFAAEKIHGKLNGHYRFDDLL
jgi:4-hydroxy-tetrahydrodipicolinate reductase